MTTATTQAPLARRTGSKAIIDLMQERAPSLAAVATKHLTPEKLTRMIGVQLTRVPKLANCTPLSVLECAMTCAELGLSPGVLGDAYLVPYGDQCTLIVGYRGLLKLARRSGHLSTIQAEVVREGDEFRFRFGMDAALQHVPKADPSAPMTHVWAMAKFRDGSYQFVVMRKSEVMGIKAKSQGARSPSSPWNVKEFEPEMWKKTALRRLCKMLPLTPEIEQQIAKIDATEFSYEDLAALPVAEDRPPTAGSIADSIDGQMKELAEAREVADQEPTPDEEARRRTIAEQAAALKAKPAECSTENPGCSQDLADYSTGPDGKRVCANHAMAAAGDSLPGMDAPAGKSRNKK